jgi:hypothetical protein
VVVLTILKNISQLGLSLPIYIYNKNVPDHQPDTIPYDNILYRIPILAISSDFPHGHNASGWGFPNFWGHLRHFAAAAVSPEGRTDLGPGISLTPKVHQKDSKSFNVPLLIGNNRNVLCYYVLCYYVLCTCLFVFVFFREWLLYCTCKPYIIIIYTYIVYVFP